MTTTHTQTILYIHDIQVNKALVDVDLSYNEIGEEGAKSFADSLKVDVRALFKRARRTTRQDRKPAHIFFPGGYSETINASPFCERRDSTSRVCVCVRVCVWYVCV